MKIAALLILLGCLQTFTRVSAQGRLTISFKNVVLSTVLEEIEKQTGYHYFMNDRWQRQAKKLSIEVGNADLKTVLAICFKDQPFTYAIIGKTIVIKEKTQDLLIIK